MKQTRERRSGKVEIRLTPTERAAIEAKAEAAGLSLSDYVRVASSSAVVKSSLDHVAMRDLAITAGTLGRAGGLLRLWLLERRGEGVPAAEIASLYDEIRAIVERVKSRLDELL